MQDMGLTPAEFREWRRTIRFTHERRIHVQVLDLDNHLLRTFTPHILDGQVMVDADAEVTRVLDLRFLDVSRSLGFEPQSPGDAPLHRSRKLRVGYSVRVPALNRWVTTWVFRGPMWDFERNGVEVSIVAHGEERQALGRLYKAMTLQAKSKRTAGIKRLAGRVGVTRMAVPNLDHTFPHDVSLEPMDQAWLEEKKIAHSMNRRLFHDGDGWLVLRRHGNRPLHVFDRELLSEVTVKRHVEGIVNVVRVQGPKPKGSKERVAARAVLHASHDLSPESLAMNGQPLYLMDDPIVNEHLKTDREAKKIAKRVLDEKVRELVEFSFDSLPIPHLDEGDLVAVVTPTGKVRLRMKQWSIPLGPDAAPMTVGSIRRTTGAAAQYGTGHL